MTAPQIIVTVVATAPGLHGLLLDLAEMAADNDTIIIVLSHDPDLVDNVLDLARGKTQEAVLSLSAQSAHVAAMAGAIDLNPPSPGPTPGK